MFRSKRTSRSATGSDAGSADLLAFETKTAAARNTCAQPETRRNAKTKLRAGYWRKKLIMEEHGSSYTHF